MGTLHENLCMFMIKLLCIHLGIRNISDDVYRGNQITHFIFNKLL
jgi:hypothetical protein